MADPMRRILVTGLMVFASISSPSAADVSKTYSYFTVAGTTLDELEQQLSMRGPQVKSTGRRHPGATQMQFTTKLGFGEKNGYCRVTQAKVLVRAKVILPRWGQRSRAEQDVRVVWDTLSSDIKRHEEGHVVIARNNARDLEKALLALDRKKTCEAVSANAKALADKMLAKHDKEQEYFDRVEGINFQRRLTRLLQYRLERIGAGKLPG